MSELPFKLVRIPSLKTVADFRNHVASLGLEIPCEEKIETGFDSPLAQPVEKSEISGKKIGNRIAIQPMEGWDGTTSGDISDEMLRRWQRFGESGAKLIYGGEAMAVRADGRTNPNQLIISEENKNGISKLRETLIAAHRERYGKTDDLVIGFQLTHSGRFCRPHDKRWESRVAYRHPILDKKFNVTSDAQVLNDADIEQIIQKYIEAAKIAAEIGADFVDIKHCHGYLLHEFLSAFTRPGKYGGSFENRTRILREIIQGIRASGNKIELGVRLSAFDFVPFKPDPIRAQPGKLGPGIPEEFPLPYPFAFGTNQNNPLEYDLTETFQFVNLCAELGVKILNISAGSPYYNPHIQRPAAYPPSDGYQPDHDPLIDVARQIEVVRQIKSKSPANLILIGSAYSYFQEYLPHIAQAILRNGWTDMIGIGRMVLSYPTILTDAISNGALTPKFICRTFSDCTTAPRNGLISGCYPLDSYYKEKPEFQKLKEIKKTTGA
ncbi:MAG: NADH:flavin oxidoreductase [Verrucomicrobiota bacterium]|nr:NADH:flavin oxidoreductase [Verrucomicrobiota bacterium]